MSIAHTLGFPRIGAARELKFAQEQFWRGETDATALRAVASQIKETNWRWQHDAGLDLVTVGDHALYDHVLNTSVLLGNIPPRFADAGDALATYFAMGRGNPSAHAQEMTKWFDTNYHYLVPEFYSGQTFSLSDTALFDDVAAAQRLGYQAKPVLLGPLSYLFLGKSKSAALDRLSLLPGIVAVYQQVLAQLASQGVRWVQIDEPFLVLDLEPAWLAALHTTYAALAGHGVKILLASYFGSVAAHADRLLALPIDGLHIDCVRAPAQLPHFADIWPTNRVLSVGIIDGRNIWKSNLRRQLKQLACVSNRGDQLWIAPSCSLLHVPVDLSSETALDAELQSWLAFARQKLDETGLLKRGVQSGEVAIAHALAVSDAARASRRDSPRLNNAAVAAALAGVTDEHAQRSAPFSARKAVQQAKYQLPCLPTTTIGSFPQTPAIRTARAAFKRGELSADDYALAMKAEIALAVEKQETLGLDVLVHGEAERNDMVEYFGEQLSGFAFTRFGWVQSYGSRCVKPPILFGDVARPAPMTVAWSAYAQSLTTKPMKGMLTGPVTILQWSFVRDDQPRALTALQIALAIRAEVVDLERAGIGIIQIDEPAFREGLPLQAAEWPDYLSWATRAFRVSASGVKAETQIHTHMCYSEFNDILPAIAAMDADVITIETSRSDMKLLDGFGKFAYPNDIGPGVYDIHSPRVPDTAEMVRLLKKALHVLPAEQLWVNPDCGLKTRAWPETEAALRNMAAATAIIRASLVA